MRFAATVALPLAAVTRAGWIDPDTAPLHLTTASLEPDDETVYELIMSDEFNTAGRRFKNGHDPKWTALNKNDYTNDALQFYGDDQVETVAGRLNITVEATDTTFPLLDGSKRKKKKTMTKTYRSAMIQGWNKFCFTGGIMESSVRLPGAPHIGGLWPAFWLMGNLVRATYVASSDWIWPWSYDECDRALQRKQVISACSPTAHYGMSPLEGRGAPEIDVLEVMPGDEALAWGMKKPYVSTSLQLGPGITVARPDNGNMPLPRSKYNWYHGMDYGTDLNSSINVFFYGSEQTHKDARYTYQADAISANSMLKKTHFEQEVTYRVEWVPDRAAGHIVWYIGGELIYRIRAANLRIPGVQTGHIPDEPMYIIFNVAMSKTWGFPNPLPPGCSDDCYDCRDPACSCAVNKGFCNTLPAHMTADYVRVWQPRNDSRYSVGCSTAHRPTRRWIDGHKERYMEALGGETEPLLKIKRGGGRCSADFECGPSGACADGRCVCDHEGGPHHQHEYVGPHCLAPNGFDDAPGDEDPKLVVHALYVPPALALLGATIATSFALVIGSELRRSHLVHPSG